MPNLRKVLFLTLMFSYSYADELDKFKKRFNELNLESDYKKSQSITADIHHQFETFHSQQKKELKTDNVNLEALEQVGRNVQNYVDGVDEQIHDELQKAKFIEGAQRMYSKVPGGPLNENLLEVIEMNQTKFNELEIKQLLSHGENYCESTTANDIKDFVNLSQHLGQDLDQDLGTKKYLFSEDTAGEPYHCVIQEKFGIETNNTCRAEENLLEYYFHSSQAPLRNTKFKEAYCVATGETTEKRWGFGVKRTEHYCCFDDIIIKAYQRNNPDLAPNHCPAITQEDLLNPDKVDKKWFKEAAKKWHGIYLS